VKIIENYTSELQRRNFSKNTVKVYTGCFEIFINNHPGQDIRYISGENILKFLKMMVDTKHISSSYQNQLINAIKFYYEQILHLPRKTYYIDRPRRESKLPVVLSKDEIRRLFAVIANLKHKSILQVIYSAGLRESEVINLKITDINSAEHLILLRQAKGNKDRYVKLSDNTLLLLREYFKVYRPVSFLFYSQCNKNEQYSASSIRQFLNKYAKLAGIIKNVYPHLIRRCYATHLFEYGTDIAMLKNALGHKNIKTTMVYTHISTQSIAQMASPDMSF